MNALASLDRAALRASLQACGADAWLLYDFKGLNPVARRMLNLGGLGSRRLFVLLPQEGDLVAIAHRIELQPLEGFPGRIIPFSRWQELHAAVREVVNGKTVAMEISAEDAVPYLDRVPFGVIELIRSLGGRVVSSSPLVTQYTARWTAPELQDHLIAAEILARIAQDHIAQAVQEVGKGLSETALQRRVLDAFQREGILADHGPIVAFGPPTANPHYEPVPGKDRTLGANEVVLIDLFGGRSATTVQADQTWIGFSGSKPAAKVQEIWTIVRDARDAALDYLATAARAGRTVQGHEVDRASRGVIERAGYGDYFVHRTGHSIDRDLHGSGPHLDDYETHDDREFLPGVGFSVEPGIYLPGEFGMRSEVNVYWGPDGPLVTPKVLQRELILP